MKRRDDLHSSICGVSDSFKSECAEERGADPVISKLICGTECHWKSTKDQSEEGRGTHPFQRQVDKTRLSGRESQSWFIT